MAFWRKKPEPLREEPQATSFFSTHAAKLQGENRATEVLRTAVSMFPGKAEGIGLDDATLDSLKINATPQSISGALANWYASQGFIGWNMCAILAQNWLIDKACSMPGRDATRNGWDIVTVDGDKLPDAEAKLLKKYDRLFRAKWNTEQFVRLGRIFGIRIAIFKIDSTDPEYYEKPFNPDGVTEGSYKGISQVDPIWCAPILDSNASSDPASIHFYEPTWWIIGGKKYHRTHLCIFRTSEAPDILKPMYLYGGIPIPQKIMERVYGAERTANEAPMLAQSKRTNVWLTDMSAFRAAGTQARNNLAEWAWYRDNFGIKVGDKEGDDFKQFETSLGDLDNVIMGQYQIVAGAANVPATKLLGTVPKGFNSTGDYEEASYHEELESIQEHDLTPFLERHHLLTMLSYGNSKTETTVSWRPLDAPTSEEVARGNLAKAQAGGVLIQSGAITPEDERRRIATDPDSGYSQLGANDMLGDDPDVLNDLGLSEEAANAARSLGLGQ